MSRSLMLIGISLALVITGCSAPASASEDCLAAASEAVRIEKELYNTHQYFKTDPPGLDASPEEFAAFDALRIDEESKWFEAQIPIYESCKGPSDWLAAANEYPLIAGLSDGAKVDTLSLELWCKDRPDDLACVGLPEWVAENGSAL